MESNLITSKQSEKPKRRYEREETIENAAEGLINEQGGGWEQVG